MNQSQNQQNQDFELIDFLWVIWKWKIAILVATLIAGGGAFAVDYFLPTGPVLYRTSIVVEPAISGYSNEDGALLFDSALNIQSVLESGLLNADALKRANLTADVVEPSDVNLTFKIPNNWQMLEVGFSSTSAEIGAKLLNGLFASLQDRYSDRVVSNRTLYQLEIEGQEKNLEEITRNLAGKEDFDKVRTAALKKRIGEIKTAILLIENQRESLKAAVRPIYRHIQSFQKNDDEKSAIYDATSISEMDRLIGAAGLYQKLTSQIDQLHFREQDLKQELFDVEHNRDRIAFGMRENSAPQASDSEKIVLARNQLQSMQTEAQKKLEVFQKSLEMVRNVNLFQRPITKKVLPPSPNYKEDVLIYSVCAFFFAVFSVFIYEYIASLRNRGSKSVGP